MQTATARELAVSSPVNINLRSCTTTAKRPFSARIGRSRLWNQAALAAGWVWIDC